jgi:four helix bundle protein
MTAVRRFEDLRVWQEARILCSKIDEATCEIVARRNFGLSDQMRNAALSVVSNISEGFDRRSDRSFRYFLLIAKGSVAELKAQLYLCADRSYLSPETVAILYQRADNVSRMLWGLIRHLEHPPAAAKEPGGGAGDGARGTT